MRPFLRVVLEVEMGQNTRQRDPTATMVFGKFPVNR